LAFLASRNAKNGIFDPNLPLSGIILAYFGIKFAKFGIFRKVLEMPRNIAHFNLAKLFFPAKTTEGQPDRLRVSGGGGY
jgi:hypothetical protein